MRVADAPGPEDLMQHPGHLLRRALQVMNQLWEEEVSPSITSPQFAALNALYAGSRIDQRTLGERISLDRSTMAEVVSRLSARGLIRAERDARDGRRKTITLTGKGLACVQQLIPRTHAMTGASRTLPSRAGSRACTARAAGPVARTPMARRSRMSIGTQATGITGSGSRVSGSRCPTTP